MFSTIYYVPSLLAASKAVYFISVQESHKSVTCAIFSTILLLLAFVMKKYRFVLFFPILSVIF